MKSKLLEKLQSLVLKSFVSDNPYVRHTYSRNVRHTYSRKILKNKI